MFGIPDDELGEALCAYVQPQEGAEFTADDVRTFVRQHLARYKVPKVVEFVDALPREDSGKIFKRKLRAPYWDKVGRQIRAQIQPRVVTKFGRCGDGGSSDSWLCLQRHAEIDPLRQFVRCSAATWLIMMDRERRRMMVWHSWFLVIWIADLDARAWVGFEKSSGMPEDQSSTRVFPNSSSFMGANSYRG